MNRHISRQLRIKSTSSPHRQKMQGAPVPIERGRGGGMSWQIWHNSQSAIVYFRFRIMCYATVCVSVSVQPWLLLLLLLFFITPI